MHKLFLLTTTGARVLLQHHCLTIQLLSESWINIAGPFCLRKNVAFHCKAFRKDQMSRKKRSNTETLPSGESVWRSQFCASWKPRHTHLPLNFLNCPSLSVLIVRTQRPVTKFSILCFRLSRNFIAVKSRKLRNSSSLACLICFAYFCRISGVITDSAFGVSFPFFATLWIRSRKKPIWKQGRKIGFWSLCWSAKEAFGDWSRRSPKNQSQIVFFNPGNLLCSLYGVPYVENATLSHRHVLCSCF